MVESPASRPPPATKRIVLVAGRVRHDDRHGHHDYEAGCRLLAKLLGRRRDVRVDLVAHGWPTDPSVLEGADAVVFYDGGGGKQGCLADDARIALVQRLVDRGGGLVMLHQAVGFPRERVELGRAWLGGVYAPGVSKRGHWKTRHERFGCHEIARGVKPYALEDGWLTGLVFAEDRRGITPLVWAAPEGAANEDECNVASWAWERPGGGRSFAYTGIDGHAAWSQEGLRRLVANGVLWAAHAPIDEQGADVSIDAASLEAMATPRATPMARLASLVRKGVAKALGRKKRW